MRTVAINVYQFEELNEQAQHYAHEKFCYESDYPFHYENEKVMNVIEDVCNIKIVNWEYDAYRYHFNIKLQNMEDINLYGEKLKTALIERFGEYMFNEKEITGYFLEMDFFFHMKKLLDKITNATTYYDVMNLCTHQIFDEIVTDMDNHYSFENFRDLCEINEWEFLEDGEMY